MIKEDKETTQFMEDCFVVSYLLMEITKQTNLSLTEKFYFALMACNLVKMVETTHTHTNVHKKIRLISLNIQVKLKRIALTNI